MAADCQVNYSEIHWGTVCVGSTDDELFKITNTGDSGQLAGTVSVPGPNFTIQGTATYDLAPSEEQWFTVRFEPQSAGFKSETVETGNALCGDVDVDGTGDDTPVCALDQATLNFGGVDVGSVGDLILQITNTGCGTLNGTASINSSYPHFEIIGDASYSLTHDQTKNITIRYTPDTYDEHTGTLETGNDTYCDDVALSGQGTLGDTIPYLKYSSAPITTVYFKRAVVLPYTVNEEIPFTISRTEDKALKVYKHNLGGDRKRIWVLTAYMKQVDDDGYRFGDLEYLWRELAQGALKQLTFRDNFNLTYTVRVVKYGPPSWQEAGDRDLIKIRLILEEDY